MKVAFASFLADFIRAPTLKLWRKSPKGRYCGPKVAFASFQRTSSRRRFATADRRSPSRPFSGLRHAEGSLLRTEGRLRVLSADFVTPKVRYCGPKAEGMRFELMVGFPTRAFQARALDRYANPPNTESIRGQCSNIHAFEGRDALGDRRMRRE